MTRIRPMTEADVAPAADVVRRGNWGERAPFFAFAVRHPECHPIVAEVDEEIVGSGVGTVHGHTGWVGMIFVAEARRGSGIGRAVTATVVDDLRDRGCDTISLVATEMGRPVYERLGFVVEDRYVGLSAPGLLASSDRVPGEEDGASRLRPWEESDLEAVFALDAWATGEDRRHLLRDVLLRSSERQAFVAEASDGTTRPVGFTAATGWGGWPTIAGTVEAGLALLQRRRTATAPGTTVRTALIERNRAGIDVLRAAGWEPSWSGVRMRLGPPIEWHPEAIWGQFNYGLG